MPKSVYINELQNAARSGDRSAEMRLFEHLTASFRLFVQRKVKSKEDGEEIVQETMVAISDKYQEIEFETSFAAWAYRVLGNKILDHHKGRSARRKAVSRLQEETLANEPDTADPLLRVKLLECLRKLVRANARYGRALNLHYQGYGTDEICTTLGVTTNNLYSVLSRARAMMISCLEKGDLS